MDLAKRIKECAQLSGDFVLRSGQISQTYFDKYQFESDPALLRAIAQAAVCVIDRLTGGKETLANIGLPLHALFDLIQIENA